MLNPDNRPGITSGVTTSVSGFTRGDFLKIVGAGLGGLFVFGGIKYAVDLLAEREKNIQGGENLKNRTLGPKPTEEANWWKVLSEEEIRNLATLPEIDQIGDKYVTTVSPAFQEKAQQAGYSLIYQGDKTDTTGRSTVTKGRQIDKYWAAEDLGFGRAGTSVRGVLKAWVPDPTDPNQKEKVYALLEDPLTHKEFAVTVQLFPYDSNQFDIRPTWFIVGNLNHGPAYAAEKSKSAGYTLNTDIIPDSNDPPSMKAKKLTDFPTFNELLRSKKLSLTDLVKPGDYIIADMQTAGVDETKGVNKYKTDELGVSRSIDIVIRRFGGQQQWQSEVQK